MGLRLTSDDLEDLYPDERVFGWFSVCCFEVELGRLLYPLHQFVDGLCLCVAAG